MIRIVKIEKIKRTKAWYNVILENGEYFVANDEIIYRENLKEGNRIKSHLLKKLEEEGEEKRGKEIALKSLSRRERSEKEIRSRLKIKGIGEKAEDNIIKNLKKYEYLNDREFARRFVNNFMNKKPSGRKLVSFELRKRGISEQIIEEELDSFFSKIDEKELAYRALKKKLKSLTNFSINGRKKKVSDFLFRRGFSWEIIDEVIKDTILED